MSKNKKKDKKAGKIIKIVEREVLKCLSSNPKVALNHKQINSAAGLQGLVSGRKLINILNNLVEYGKIDHVGKGQYQIPGQAVTLIGTLDMARDGFGFVQVEGREDDIFINQDNIATALSGDTVEVRVTRQRRRDKRTEGAITKVVERKRTQFVGVIDDADHVIWFEPDDPRIHFDFRVKRTGLKGAKDGQKVLAEIVEWKKEVPIVEVLRILGQPGEHEAEIHAIIYQYGFVPDFPPDVEEEAAAIPQKIPAAEIKKRRDMRKTTTFTIDPADAKDFDDAISYEKLDDGNMEIGIHIADVTHYVRPGSRLDEEGRDRATSVYLVDRTVPMLPETLSNNLCSLRPNEDKLTFSAVFKMNAEGAILDEWFGRTVIHSDRRFTYEEAQERLETEAGEYAGELKTLNELAHVLRKARFQKGSLHFEEDEVRFELDENGKPIRVFKKVRKDAHKLVEDFMLLANRRVAEFVHNIRKEAPLTFVYRIHDRPDEEKLGTLKAFVKNFGYDLDLSNKGTTVSSMNSLLMSVEGKPEQNVIASVAIRTMAKAIYTTENIGHYGLGFKYYTHFTSPIRRYPDMMVHRLLAQYLNKNQKVQKDKIIRDCSHSSKLERKATEAERASIKYKQVEFLSDKIGQEFEGIISGVTARGLYVEIIENKCEGMVRLRDIEGDYYDLDESNYCVIGRKSGTKIHLGDKVLIRIQETNMAKRLVDFELIKHMANPFDQFKQKKAE